MTVVEGGGGVKEEFSQNEMFAATTPPFWQRSSYRINTDKGLVFFHRQRCGAKVVIQGGWSIAYAKQLNPIGLEGKEGGQRCKIRMSRTRLYLGVNVAVVGTTIVELEGDGWG